MSETYIVRTPRRTLKNTTDPKKFRLFVDGLTHAEAVIAEIVKPKEAKL